MNLAIVSSECPTSLSSSSSHILTRPPLVLRGGGGHLSVTPTPAGPDEFLGVCRPRVAAHHRRHTGDPPVAGEAYPQPAEGERRGGREGIN